MENSPGWLMNSNVYRACQNPWSILPPESIDFRYNCGNDIFRWYGPLNLRWQNLYCPSTSILSLFFSALIVTGFFLRRKTHLIDIQFPEIIIIGGKFAGKDGWTRLESILSGLKVYLLSQYEPPKK